MGGVEMIDPERWAEFLGTAKATAYGPRKGPGLFGPVTPRTEIDVSREYEHQYLPHTKNGVQWLQDRPFWGWDLGYESDVRTCWLCHKLIPMGHTGVYVSSLKRQVHTRCLTPSQWHTILGQPYGGDSRIMGELRARQTREAKKSV